MAASFTPRRWIFRITAIGLIVYAGFVGFLVMTETSAVYIIPEHGPSEPAEASLENYRRHTLETDQGPAITYWENSAPEGAPTILYFHGNYGGLYFHKRSLAYLDAQKIHVIGMEYPGYPGAPGHPSQALITADAITLYDRLRQHGPVGVWGYSLGSGVATQLAAQRPVEMLILEAPFTAVVDRAAEIFPFIPVRYLMRNTYLSREAITKNHAPLLILHGDNDHVIPLHHGQALFAIANEPKTMHVYPGAGHLDLIDFGADHDAVAFIRRH